MMQLISPQSASLLPFASGSPSVQRSHPAAPPKPRKSLLAGGAGSRSTKSAPEASTVVLRSHRIASPFWIILLLRLPVSERRMIQYDDSMGRQSTRLRIWGSGVRISSGAPAKVWQSLNKFAPIVGNVIWLYGEITEIWLPSLLPRFFTTILSQRKSYSKALTRLNPSLSADAHEIAVLFAQIFANHRLNSRLGQQSVSDFL
jgi:hypothetical protein